MKLKHILLFSTLILFSLLISACSSTAYASTGWHGLAVSTDTVYLAAGGQVYAIDLNTHSEKWKYPEKPNAKGFYANPVLAPDGQLLVPSYDNILYSLDAATGNLKWKFPQTSSDPHKAKGRLIASPLVIQDTIYQPSSDGHLYALDLQGNYKWDATTGRQIWAAPATDPTCGCIYVVSMDHFVYKFNAADGSLIKKSPDLEGAIVGTPTIGSDGTLYVGTFGKEMYALNGSDLSIKWRFSTHDWVWAGPALANNVLYFGDLAGNFYALKAADGTASFGELQVNNPIVDTPLVSGDKLYFTAESDTLFMVDPSGNINSKVVGGKIYSAPVDAGDTILVAPTNFTAQLVALSLDGTQKWVFPPPK